MQGRKLKPVFIRAIELEGNVNFRFGLGSVPVNLADVFAVRAHTIHGCENESGIVTLCGEAKKGVRLTTPTGNFFVEMPKPEFLSKYTEPKAP